MPEEVWRPLDLLVPPHDNPKVNLRDLGYEISSKKAVSLFHKDGRVQVWRDTKSVRVPLGWMTASVNVDKAHRKLFPELY
jgi:hypothetical protein